MRVLFLDIDGVMNRTGFRPAEPTGLRSWIEPELAQRLSAVVRAVDAHLVLSSDWRIGRELVHLRGELAAAGVDGTLLGVTPVLSGKPRWREIHSWMADHRFDAASVAIVDDLLDMGPLAPRFVRCSPLAGLDEAAASAIFDLFGRSAR